ncbi:glycoside hydrolase family protein [Campylobacter lanienae]|uniref:glycoside hydrolase family protein n=1 Tax=Campylobacter lanienae TaxID=75658 RepID=UPI000BB3F85A|nr:lysozyme [Campylobacter lanienae]
MSLIESIKVNEGFRANIYQCTAGVDTVGYGFNVNYLEEDELALNKGVVEPMTPEVAHKILELKLEKLKAALIREFSWVEQKPIIVQEALLEMAYQLGIPKMKSFSQTLTYIKEDNYQQAAINLRKSKWAKQTPKRVENLIRSLQNA